MTTEKQLQFIDTVTILREKESEAEREREGLLLVQVHSHDTSYKPPEASWGPSNDSKQTTTKCQPVTLPVR